MELQTKYITLDEFEQYFKIDLRTMLKTEEDALAFLKRIENRMESFVDSCFNRSITLEYPSFTQYQREHYKLALLEQGIYIFRNGDVSVDSGYDTERGEILPRGKVKQLSIAPNAENELRLCGIWNRNLRRHTGNPWWW